MIFTDEAHRGEGYGTAERHVAVQIMHSNAERILDTLGVLDTNAYGAELQQVTWSPSKNVRWTLSRGTFPYSPINVNRAELQDTPTGPKWITVNMESLGQQVWPYVEGGRISCTAGHTVAESMQTTLAADLTTIKEQVIQSVASE